jgi:hypothetical protein
MPKTHPHAEATYRIIERDDGFGVEVTVPETFPTVVSGFATQEAAETWISDHKRQVKEGDPGMRARRKTWNRAG